MTREPKYPCCQYGQGADEGVSAVVRHGAELWTDEVAKKRQVWSKEVQSKGSPAGAELCMGQQANHEDT